MFIKSTSRNKKVWNNNNHRTQQQPTVNPRHCSIAHRDWMKGKPFLNDIRKEIKKMSETCYSVDADIATAERSVKCHIILMYDDCRKQSYVVAQTWP